MFNDFDNPLGSFSEGIVGGDGFVYSSVDDKPLDSVTVIIYLNDKLYDSTLTDTNGFFRASEFVGCRGSPAVILYFFVPMKEPVVKVGK